LSYNDFPEAARAEERAAREAAREDGIEGGDQTCRSGSTPLLFLRRQFFYAASFLRHHSLSRRILEDRRTLLGDVIVGALVLVEVTASITEASMTLSPSSPCTLSSSSTTAIGWPPIMQVQPA